MNVQAAPEYFELSDYTGVIRRRWRRIAVAGCAGLILAAAYVVLAPKTYAAAVLVQVNALPNNANEVGGRTGGPVNMDNEAQAVRSTAVTTIVKAHLHSSLSPADIAQNIKVTVPPNTTYLQITCAASSAIGAQACANAVGDAYLYNRRVSLMNLIGTGIRALRQDAAKLQNEIERYKILLFTGRHKRSTFGGGTPAQISDSLRLGDAQTALTSVQAHIDAAKPLFDSMTVPNSAVVGTIASPATVPQSPSSPRKLLYLPSGLIVGLVVGLAWAFLRDRRDKRVHSARDVERLADVPTLLNLAPKPGGPLRGLESPRSAAGRAFTELARSLDASLGEGSHALVVAATAPGAGGSVVAVNLAAALTRTCDRTILICADMMGTKAPEMLGVGRGRGLSDLLGGTAKLSEVASAAGDLPGLRVITPGVDAARAVLVMQQAKLRHLVSDALDDSRYVVIEAQSVGEDSDGFGMAQFAEAAIVAVEVERSRPADVVDCVHRLGRLGTPVFGTTILRTAVPASRKTRPALPAAQAALPVSLLKGPQTQLDTAFSGPASSSGTTVWTPGTPKVSGGMSDVAATGGPRWTETKPLPNVTATERDKYPSPADPATGD